MPTSTRGAPPPAPSARGWRASPSEPYLNLGSPNLQLECKPQPNNGRISSPTPSQTSTRTVASISLSTSTIASSTAHRGLGPGARRRAAAERDDPLRALIKASAQRVVSCHAGKASAHSLVSSVSAPALARMDQLSTPRREEQPPPSPDQAVAPDDAASPDSVRGAGAKGVAHHLPTPPSPSAGSRAPPRRHVTFRTQPPSLAERAAAEFEQVQHAGRQRLESALEERQRLRESIFALRHAKSGLGDVVERHQRGVLAASESAPVLRHRRHLATATANANAATANANANADADADGAAAATPALMPAPPPQPRASASSGGRLRTSASAAAAAWPGRPSLARAPHPPPRAAREIASGAAPHVGLGKSESEASLGGGGGGAVGRLRALSAVGPRRTVSHTSLPRGRSAGARVPLAPICANGSDAASLGPHASSDPLSSVSTASVASFTTAATAAASAAPSSASLKPTQSLPTLSRRTFWRQASCAIGGTDGGALQLWQALSAKAQHRDESEGARWLREDPDEAAEVVASLFDELRSALAEEPTPPVALPLVERLFERTSSVMISREGGRELLLPLLRIAAEHAAMLAEDLRRLTLEFAFPMSWDPTADASLEGEHAAYAFASSWDESCEHALADAALAGVAEEANEAPAAKKAEAPAHSTRPARCVEAEAPSPPAAAMLRAALTSTPAGGTAAAASSGERHGGEGSEAAKLAEAASRLGAGARLPSTPEGEPSPPRHSSEATSLERPRRRHRHARWSDALEHARASPAVHSPVPPSAATAASAASNDSSSENAPDCTPETARHVPRAPAMRPPLRPGSALRHVSGHISSSLVVAARRGEAAFHSAGGEGTTPLGGAKLVDGASPATGSEQKQTKHRSRLTQIAREIAAEHELAGGKHAGIASTAALAIV